MDTIGNVLAIIQTLYDEYIIMMIDAKIVPM